MDPIITDSLTQVSAVDTVAVSNALADSVAALKQTVEALKTQVGAANEANASNTFTTNNLWMMIATALVFIMHLGFATLESGLTRAKNTTNVLFKNTVTPGIGILTHAICGFNLMYPGFAVGSMEFIGFPGFGVSLPEGGGSAAYNPGFTYWTDFLYQAMFAATSATVVSGAVAERIKLSSYMIFAIIFTAFIYPVVGSWAWGKGWLNTIGFHDFAGSTLVHSVGGWAALAGIILLGSRMGKYEKGRIYPIPGHNMTSCVIGTFMLWLGWFGFNGGSVLSADPALVSSVLMATTLAASAGAITAALTIFIVSKNYDLTMVLNGILAGLVGITAGADLMNPMESIVIGGVAGIIVVFSVIMFDNLKLDDPVGATSVHLVCGIWGTLAVGIFGAMASSQQLIAQLIGIAACGAATFAMSFLIFAILKYTMGIRVSKEEEIYGLDVTEHGMEAYSNFLMK